MSKRTGFHRTRRGRRSPWPHHWFDIQLPIDLFLQLLFRKDFRETSMSKMASARLSGDYLRRVCHRLYLSQTRICCEHC